MTPLPAPRAPAPRVVPTPAQRAAITAPLGPVLVVAGPGAGKTYCLIERIHHLVTVHGIPPSRLLAVTFTNKAANEIRARLEARLGEPAHAITGGTLHALCAAILRDRGPSVGVPQGFGIADEPYQRAVLARLRVPPRRRGQVLQLFGQARFKGYSLTEGDDQLLAQYETILRERELLDFDQLVARTVELLRRSMTAAEEVAAQWDAVLVDEFQDLDRKQYAMLKVLTEGHRNVFAVGDDEQSIFAWRGAEPAVLGIFQRDFGLAQPVVLDRNLRCAKPIFAAARRLIDRNPALFAKEIAAERASAFPVMVQAFESDADEAIWIVADLLADKGAHGLAYSDYAVLYRQHAHAHRVERALLNAMVPCRFAKGRALKDDEVIGYVIGALQLALSPDDPELLDLFAESQLPRKLLNRVRAATPEGDILQRLRTFADTEARDADTRRAWRFIYHVENLAGAVRAHTALHPLVDELITLRIGTWDNRLEREADRLLDPMDDPAARALAARLDGLTVPSMEGGLDVPLRSMLARARVRSREGGHTLSGADAGPDGMPVTLFRALQLREAQYLGHAFQRYVTFDLETTSNDTSTCDIVEIGAVRVVDGVVTERFETLVRPDGPISAGATAVHGITGADVASAPRLEDVWERFRAFVGDDLLMAHNAHHFDFPVLNRLARGLRGIERMRVFDTLPLARAVSAGSAKLHDLAVRFGVNPGTSHRAPDDAFTLAQVFPRLEAMRIARSRKAAHASLLDDLALAIVLDPAPRTDHAALLFDLGRTVTLGPHSKTLDVYGEQHDVAVVIELLGGKGLMEKLRRERSPLDRYPEAVERLRGYLDVPGETIEDQMRGFLDVVALSSSAGEVDLDRHAVNLLTLHATKGLEFSRVYIVGVEDGTMPGYRAVRDHDEDEIQEGRRVLYVGMTRARDRLVLTRAGKRDGFDGGGSRYLDEMGLSP